MGETALPEAPQERTRTELARWLALRCTELKAATASLTKLLEIVRVGCEIVDRVLRKVLPQCNDSADP